MYAISQHHEFLAHSSRHKSASSIHGLDRSIESSLANDQAQMNGARSRPLLFAGCISLLPFRLYRPGMMEMS